MYLNQFNIGRIKYPLDNPGMCQFVKNVQRINNLAEQMDGFIWRLKDETNTAMYMRVYDDPMILPNLTVWRDALCLYKFVFNTVHKKFFEARRQWFEPVMHSSIMWWGQEHMRPSLIEGIKRRDYLINNGETRHAFSDYHDAERYLDEINNPEKIPSIVSSKALRRNSKSSLDRFNPDTVLQIKET